jgi:hypothetical protein
MRSKAVHTPRGRRAPFALALLVALCLLPAGCGNLKKDDGDPIPLGPGSGGLAVTNPSAPQDIPGTTSSRIGTFQFDSDYFLFSAQTPTTDDTSAGQLVDRVGDNLLLQLGLIYGRADTPCRFHAALSARDDGFTIEGDTTKRLNDLGVVFYEVLLYKAGEFRRFDCAELSGNAGVEVLSDSGPNDLVGTLQVHFVLNSIRP